jgi:hypothetical protein
MRRIITLCFVFLVTDFDGKLLTQLLMSQLFWFYLLGLILKMGRDGLHDLSFFFDDQGAVILYV